MTVQSRPHTNTTNDVKLNESTGKTKVSTPNKGSKCSNKTGNSSGKNSVKINTNSDRFYAKIGEVFSRDEVNKGSNNKIAAKNKKKTESPKTKAANDDEIDLISDMTEREKTQWVEDYLSHLPEYSKIGDPVSSKTKLKISQRADSATYLYKTPMLTYMKSDFFNSPYIVSNITNFSKKNHSFNKYQTWKIRRENLKICEKIKNLESRKSSTGLYQLTVTKPKDSRNSKAINRSIENQRINAENMAS